MNLDEMIYMEPLAKIISNPMAALVFIFGSLILHTKSVFVPFIAGEVNMD